MNRMTEEGQKRRSMQECGYVHSTIHNTNPGQEDTQLKPLYRLNGWMAERPEGTPAVSHRTTLLDDGSVLHTTTVITKGSREYTTEELEQLALPSREEQEVIHMGPS